MLAELLSTLLSTVWDVVPIAVVVVVFQLLVLRRKIPHPRRVLVGFAYVLLGLALFLAGLEQALFPIGRLLARELTEIAQHADALAGASAPVWQSYYWVYLFGAAIGFATTVAEPSLIAVAIKANEVSGGTISVRGLRVAVAIGVAAGIGLGTYRIVAGLPLQVFIIAGYVVVMLQTAFAPRTMVALAYDSGGVTTSTVTVPVVTALGLGLASTVPGRDPALDGFGLIAFASVFPIMTVLGYAQLSHLRRRAKPGDRGTGEH